MSKATLTIEGFVAKDPELSSYQGKAVTNVSVAHTPRRKNQQTGQYEDAGPTLWVQASFWEQDAENIVAQVSKGTLVTITGQPELRTFTKQDGTFDASLTLKFGTLGIIPRGQARPAQSSPVQEPWSTPGSSTQADAWATPGGDFSDNAPF